MLALQQVNLYRPALSTRKARGWPSTRVAVSAALVLVLGLALAPTAWQLQQSRSALQQVKQELVERQRILAEREAAVVNVDPAFSDATVAALEAEVARTQQELSVLQRYMGPAPARFSELFAALARQHLAGLWLTRIDVKDDGRQVTLGGYAADPALVPRYAARLRNEAALAGVQFRTLRIGKPADGKSAPASAVEFLIATQDAEELDS